MLGFTREGIRALQEVMHSARTGAVRIRARPTRFLRDGAVPVRVETVRAPSAGDIELLLHGARVYLDVEALKLLHDKVLHARPVRDGLRFEVYEQPALAREDAAA